MTSMTPSMTFPFQLPVTFFNDGEANDLFNDFNDLSNDDLMTNYPPL